MPSNIAITDEIVTAPGGRLFTRRWMPPAANGSPVLMLHDSLGCIDLWRDFPEQLALRLNREVIAYDRLGFGRSSERTDTLTGNFIHEEADVYFPAVLAALAIDQYSLFGHSVGGGMALTIASKPDTRCISVVSESAQAFIEDITLAGVRKAKKVFARPGQIAKLEKWHGVKARWVLNAWVDTWLSPAFANWTLADILPQVKCPVLTIHGSRDDYGSVAFPELIAGMAGGPAEKLIFEGGGHVPHREKQAEVLAAVETFYRAYGI